MKYLMLCCFEEKRWDAMSSPQRDGIMRDYGEWIRSLTESGHHLSGAQLQSVATSTTLRGGSGKPTVVDGPFAETKEQLGGYHLMECGSLDEALALAKRIPTLAFGGTVEVRPLVPGA